MNKKIISKIPTKREKLTIRLLILLGLISIINFFYWFLKPQLIDNHFLYWLLMGPLVFDSLRIIYIWYHYWDISVPITPKLSKNPSVDVFTTYFPGEPYEMIKETLLAIQRVKYPHTTYLCDEANDSYLKEFCKANGVIHVTRNTRINAKAGNINNALLHASGDICVILDPDHVPKENFLDKIIPYFEDEKIGFVQSVQAYYNVEESLVARGAAEQTYHFYGPIMMTMNSYGTVNAIGANCVFRRKALDSIGGHAPGLSEDMHTAMQLFAKGWKSVYIPEIFTKGLVPSSLTSYYKQQLKWSRGTLELLVSVYPKLFKVFSWRQKLHFGILPLHYLSGIFLFISFLIPIFSLFSATTPWKGNIINFGLIFGPLFTTILGIRFYVQRWVTDKNERGTHLMGGVLLACTWWINIIGFVYTIIRKKVPYLPTPKEDTERTSWKILIPNLVVGTVSVFAVIYGLSIDFTPFSILMSGFALLNASFMFYTLKFAYQKPKKEKPDLGFKVEKYPVRMGIQNFAYYFWHKLGLPMVILILIIFGAFHFKTEFVKWGGVQPEIQKKNVINYIGVFAPQIDNGISSLSMVKDVSRFIDEKFDIVSLYIAWDKNMESNFPELLLDSIYTQKSIPMITWEPWLNSFEGEIDSNKHVYELIEEGYFDTYILGFAEKLKKLQRPVFLRFAHEFDNPFYPWFYDGEEASVYFKKAWIHTYEIFKNTNAVNVIWIWNPWKSDNMVSFYPGKEYIDWIGVNILNYGKLNTDGEWRDFYTLYEPFHEELENFPYTPVMISEFGTLRTEKDQDKWIENAFFAIENNFSEVKSVIYFDSKVDNNWPKGLVMNENLDWTITNKSWIKNSFSSKEVPDYVFSQFPELKSNRESDLPADIFELKNIKGINITLGHDWRKDYYVLNRKNLLSDFEKIKTLGINTIKFDGNTIYSYNLLNISNELGLKTSYEFWIPPYLDFVEDTTETEKLKQFILRKISRQKDHSNIVSWNIQNDVLYQQKDFYLKPRLFYQNLAYLIWLQDLVKKIKKIDPSRPVLVGLEVNQLSIYHSNMILNHIEGVDGLGLIVKNSIFLNSIVNHLENSNTGFVYGEIEADTLIQSDIFKTQESFFIKAWRDKHESNKISFDGIVDRKGRYKAEYFKLINANQKSKLTISEPNIRIIRPAALIYDNRIYDYYSMFYTETDGWIYGSELTGYKFEWALVKCDKYGNYLAVKDVGEGPMLKLKIPKDYKYFRLLLTASNENLVTTTITTLNTPLFQE